jgi:hypothetical protein
MPNYCFNTLLLNYDNYDFLRSLQTVKFDFELFHPCPKNLTNDEEYNWRCSNWGTKWSCMDPTFNFLDDSHLRIDFSTAWMPPIEFLKVFSAKYPEMLIFLKYDEPMQGFYGHSQIFRGAVIDHVHQHYTEAQLDNFNLRSS